MDRIGIAASKVAKGNIILYHIYVFFFIFLFAFFIFIAAGAAIITALMIVGYIINGLLPHSFFEEWKQVVMICLSSLTAVVSFFSIVAFIKNFRIKISDRE